MVYLDAWSSVVLLDASSMSVTNLVPNTTYLKLRANSYGLSPDKKFVFLAHNWYKVINHNGWALKVIKQA